MPKNVNRRRAWITGLLVTLVGGLSAIAAVVWNSPDWLRPHAPVADPQLVIVEGFLLEDHREKFASYLKAHPRLPVVTSGSNRASLVYHPPEPGTLIWKFETRGFEPDPAGTQPGMRLKGHSKGCNGQEASWRVVVNGDTLFKGIMPTYEAREFNYQTDSVGAPLEEIAITFDHPDPDTSCKWIIWYLFADGMENVSQKIYYYPKNPNHRPYSLGATTAETGKMVLVEKGVAPGRIQSVSPLPTAQMRTYHSAEAAIKYVRSHYPHIRRINLLTSDYHARRSWECYRKAATSGRVNIGVVNLTPDDRSLKEIWNNPEDQYLIRSQLAKYAGWLLYRWFE